MKDFEVFDIESRDHKIEKLTDSLQLLALEMVETEARKILRAYPNLKEFIMAMGTWFFTTVNPTASNKDCFSKMKYLNELKDFFDQWDSKYKLTGCPMRFTAKGEKITYW